MLGSWSFNGKYFKMEAIDMAYDLLVNVYGIDPSRLYATYFMGDENSGLEPDMEAREYWTKYLPEGRVIGCPAKDNFWEVSLRDYESREEVGGEGGRARRRRRECGTGVRCPFRLLCII